MKGRVKRKPREPKVRLPGAVREAWGIRDRSDRGPRPGLSVQRIVESAVELASVEGLGAVSMGRVAGELDVATMSLYRYVSAKDELLALMMDAAFATPPEPAAPNEGWRRALSRWARANLTVLRRHPWVVRIPISGPPILPNQVLWFERGLGCLRRTGLPEREKLSALLLINGFVRSEALLTSDLEISARAAGGAANQAMASYGQLLSELVDAQRFPAISALLEAGVFRGSDVPDVEFDFGLERILDGVAALVSRR
jgi:AcrR family transcriptional regulator